MTERGQNIIQSLELVGGLHGDPAPEVYSTLFRRHPDLEAHFVVDRDGSVRGSMLQHAFECIIDYFDADLIASNFITASRVVHDGYGVPVDKFDEFFIALRDTFRSLLGDKWTSEMEEEWETMLKDFSQLV